MKYFIVLDNSSNITGFYATSDPNTKIANTIEILESDYGFLQSHPYYDYKYIEGEIVNIGVKQIQTEPLSVEEQKLTEISDNISLLVELQADMIGGAV